MLTGALPAVLCVKFGASGLLPAADAGAAPGHHRGDDAADAADAAYLRQHQRGCSWLGLGFDHVSGLVPSSNAATHMRMIYVVLTLIGC